MTRRTRIHIGVGDTLETVGAVVGCLAVAHLAGLWWGLLLAAAFLIVAANLVYAQHRISLGLPNRQDVARLRYRAGAPVRALSRRGRVTLARVRR